MGKRALALLCVLLLALPAVVLCEPAGGMTALLQVAEDARIKASLEERLADYLSLKRRGTQEILLGDWRLKAEGYAYKIPAGLSSSGRYGNAAVSLMAPPDGTASFRTVITVTITGEDKDLAGMTPEKARGAFSGNFRNFRLLDFERDTLCGETCVRIVSTWSDNPQLLMLQRLMNKNGSCFIFTLMVVNTPAAVRAGLHQFNAFCESLVFTKLPQP